MRRNKISEVIGNINQKYVNEATAYTGTAKVNRRSVWMRWGAIAACFAIAVSTVFVINYINKPVVDLPIVNQPNSDSEKEFIVKNGVLLSYIGNQTDITIPETVSKITNFAFIENKNADKIEVVRLGASVEKVEINAFAGLSNLVKIIVDENNTAFVDNDGLIMSVDGNMLLHYEREDELFFEMPSKVRWVGAHAVQQTELEKINFGNKLEHIGYNAFMKNYNLKAINLPDSVTYIGKKAFAECVSADEGYIPKNVEFDGDAFEGVPFYISQIINMTVGEIESVYGTMTEVYSEQGSGQPVYILERVPGIELVFYDWQYGVPLEKTIKPTEILVTENKTAIVGLAVLDDISIGADRIHEYDASMTWDYTGVFVKIKYDEFYVTYRMQLSVLEFNKWGSNYAQMEKEFMDNPKGEIIQIRIEQIK